MVGHLFQNYDTIYVHENHEKWRSKEREAGGSVRIQNKKHGIYRVNGGKEYKASRLGGLERVRGGEKVII